MNGILLDENLPRKVTFTTRLPVIHASSLGDSPSDTRLWDFARAESLVILTKDTDFSQRIMRCDPPPWVVWIRFGNMRKRDFHALLARVWSQVEALLPAHKLVQVHRHCLEGVRGSHGLPRQPDN
jgi:predicted nuclease of predicted toxin-antitoxin system